MDLIATATTFPFAALWKDKPCVVLEAVPPQGVGLLEKGGALLMMIDGSLGWAPLQEIKCSIPPWLTLHMNQARSAAGENVPVKVPTPGILIPRG